MKSQFETLRECSVYVKEMGDYIGMWEGEMLHECANKMLRAHKNHRAQEKKIAELQAKIIILQDRLIDGGAL